MKKFYTDYAFHIILGDEFGKEAPIREIEVLAHADDICHILIDGHFDACLPIYYIYKESGRYGKVPHITVEDIPSHP